MALWNNERVRDLVVRTLIGEGARDDRDSMISVAHVLKNRADSGRYGDQTVNGLTNTITARNQAGQYQFSMWHPSISSSGKTISSSDPRYERAGAIADAVFSGQIPDNTGGADHYYAPSGMPGGRAPSWAVGRTPTATIGGQHFYKLGLSEGDATNFGHTSGGPIGAPAPPLAPLGDAQPQANAAIADALAAARRMLGKNEVPDHDEIVKYLHDGGQDLDPHKLAWCASFVSATLQKAGLPVPTQVAKGSLVGAGANARNYLNYGTGVTDPGGVQAGDILVAKDGSHVGFAEGPVRQGPKGPEVQLLAGNEKDTSGQYTPGSYTNPETGAVANRAQVGVVGERWVPLSNYQVRRPGAGGDTIVSGGAPAGQGGIGSDARAPLEAAPVGTPPAVSTIVGGGGGGAHPEQTGQQQQIAAPGAERFSMLQGMTAGTSHNPELYTAANLGALFGGGTPATPPAAAPAAAAAPSTQPVTAPPPTPAPAAPAAPTAPPNAPVNEKPGSILSSILPNWGATTEGYDPDKHPSLTPDAHMPGGLGSHPATTPGQPTMGFPAMQNPFGAPPTSPDQTSMLPPGSMLSSAQNLIRLLFPNVG